MSFSISKLLGKGLEKEKYFSVFFTALLVSCAFVVPAIILNGGIFPFYGSLGDSQIAIYKECHRAVTSIELLWNQNSGLGAGLFDSFGFYCLGSPLFWLTLPFKNSLVPYLLGPLLILKISLSALTAYLFMRHFTKKPSSAMLGALLYAFSGFSIGNIFSINLLDMVVFFPLLLLNLELSLTKNRRFALCLTVFICALLNFFLFIGVFLVTVIYLILRLCSLKKNVRLVASLLTVFEILLGIALAGVMLLPSLFSFSKSFNVGDIPIGFGALLFSAKEVFARIFESFFPSTLSESNTSFSGWLPLFGTVGIFTLFTSKQNRWLKRLCGICIALALIPIASNLFFGYNVNFAAPWFYMPILFFALASVLLLEEENANWNYGFKWSLGFTAALAIITAFLPTKNADDELVIGLFNKENSAIIYFSFIVAFVCIIGFKLLLKLLKSKTRAFYISSVISACVIAAICGNMFVLTNLSSLDKKETALIESAEEIKSLMTDTGNYRVDFYDGLQNAGYYSSMPTTTLEDKTLLPSVKEFCNYVGLDETNLNFTNEAYAVRNLLSVKYLYNHKLATSFVNEKNRSTEMPGFSYLETNDEIYVYENENFVPFGFSYDYYMSYSFCNRFEKGERSHLMLKAILLTDSQIEKYNYMFDNITLIDAEETDEEETENEPLTEEIDPDILVDPEYTLDEEPDSTTEELKKSAFDFSSEALELDCQDLSNTSATNFSIDNLGFSATVSRNKETLVFFSIPFDEGWSATVNGAPAEIEKVNAGFMAVKVGTGISEIRFYYTTKGLKNGLLMTAVSAVVFLLYIIIYILFSHSVFKGIPEKAKKIVSQIEFEKPEEELYIEPAEPDDEISLPQNGFSGGFQINPDAFDEDTHN